MSNFFLSVLVFGIFVMLSSGQVSISSSTEEKFQHLNVPGDPYISQQQREMRKAIYESITPAEMGEISSLIRTAHERGDYFQLSTFGGLIAKFDAQGEKYDRDVCVNLIIEILESKKDNESSFFMHLIGVSKVSDAKLVSYLNSLDGKMEPGTKKLIAEMNTQWLEKNRSSRKPSKEINGNHSNDSKSLVVNPADEADEVQSSNSSMLIALGILFAVVVCVTWFYSSRRKHT